MTLMGIRDTFRQSFLEGFAGEVTLANILVSLGSTCLLALYVFFIYRIITKKTFYSKNMNISMAAVSVITAGIILAVQSNFVISLGMVGALSIVRFRTAIKDPMDLVFLFWSISIGIICGAGLAQIAVAMSLLLTVGIFILNRLPIGRAPTMMVVNANNADLESEIIEAVQKYCKYYEVKSRSVSEKGLDIVLELRLRDEQAVLKEVSIIEGVMNTALLSHDGEVTY